MSKLTLLVNNNGTMDISQEHVDSAITVHSYHNTRDFDNHINDITVSPSDMTMLINYYCYVKNNNNQCDFINPNGTNAKGIEVTEWKNQNVN